MIATAMARQATPIPAFSPIERPEEEDGEDEDEDEDEVSEVRLELGPAEEVEVAWPNAVDDAVVASHISSVRHHGWKLISEEM